MATTTLTIKDQEIAVADLPTNIQQAVAFYDEAEVRLRKAEADLVLASSASKWLVSDITRLVDTWMNEEKAEEVAEGAEAETVEEAAAE
jgi:hypothetical protein